MHPATHDLWHQRYDGHQDHDKLLGVYSTKEKAEQAVAQLRVKPGFRDYPEGFEILEGPIDETYSLEGFVSVWGDEGPDRYASRGQAGEIFSRVSSRCRKLIGSSGTGM